MQFCDRFGLRLPILLAPMAGACPPSLSAAVASAGGLGGCGALTAVARGDQGLGRRGARGQQRRLPDQPLDSRSAAAARRGSRGRGARLPWPLGPEAAAEAGDAPLHDFAAQCEAMLEAGPAIVSSIMGVYPPATSSSG